MNFKKFKNKKVVVLGDMIADEYIYGETARISREAPVLILEQQDRRLKPGGAANVVANIRAMGGCPIPIGVVGGDDYGAFIWEYFRNNDISTEGLKIDERKGHRTIVKTRLMAGSHNTVCQQVLRLDRKPEDIHKKIMDAMEDTFYTLMDSADVVVVSDYGEHTIRDSVITNLKMFVKPILVDSRYRISMFEGVHTLVPNVDEIRAATLNNDLQVAMSNLFDRTKPQHILLKRGKHGIKYGSKSGSCVSYDAYGSDEVADVTGAGDTVLAAYALAIATDEPPSYAAQLANVAGGLQVTKAGTAVVTKDELKEHWESYNGTD